MGDAKPVTLIEDTAVALSDLADYSLEVQRWLRDQYQMDCVYYGHAGAGELHLRPIINLKEAEGLRQFREIGEGVADIVKKYDGSLSGEHGDGRLRGELLRRMIGEANVELLREVKALWDPEGVFNPGKITDAPPLDERLRYSDSPDAGIKPGALTEIDTIFDFSETEGLLRAAEMCNGTGACRKTQLSGGTMCPSYMATREEKDSTRARANVMRQVLTEGGTREALNHPELKEVDGLVFCHAKVANASALRMLMSPKLKAEFLQAYYDENGVPLRTRLIASVDRAHWWGSWVPWLHNFFISNRWTSALIKRISRFHPQRQIPRLAPQTLRRWFARRTRVNHQNSLGSDTPKKYSTVYLFCDEFTNYLDAPVGIAAVELLEALGYEVRFCAHGESGRAALSKGLLRQAKRVAEQNVKQLSEVITDETPLVGIEPSAILSLKDEYIDLVGTEWKSQTQQLASRTWLIDDFLSEAIERGEITSQSFVDDEKTIRLHGHCHQKALTSLRSTVRALQLPRNYQVKLIPSGCCGMAGSFGYEQEHYELSMKVGELVLFPTLRNEPDSSLIAAPGTSCRHQIWDGVRRQALHPVEILRQALKDPRS